MSASDILKDAGVEVPEALQQSEDAKRDLIGAGCSGGSFICYPPETDAPVHHALRSADAALEALAREVVKWEAVSRVNAEECRKWRWVAEHDKWRDDDRAFERNPLRVREILALYKQEAKP